MANYFFDLKSSDTFSLDEEGIELPDAEAAHDVALDALFSTARDTVLEGCKDQHYAVEVRDETGPVLEIVADFHSSIFRTQ